MMYLAQKPSRGIVNVFGKNVNFTNRDSLSMLRRKIGVVFQDFRLLDHLSAFDNVALPLRVCGMEEREVRKRVKELLQWVELDRHILDTPATLSGGEKQRIAIARAVINRPELLLADEPTGNVDNDIAPKLMKLFVELNKLGTTVVIATHSENSSTISAIRGCICRTTACTSYIPATRVSEVRYEHPAQHHNPQAGAAAQRRQFHPVSESDDFHRGFSVCRDAGRRAVHQFHAAELEPEHSRFADRADYAGQQHQQGKALEETLDHQTRAVRFLEGRSEIEKVTPLQDEQLEQLIKPWLGDGVNIKDLPVPRLIDVRLKKNAEVDFIELAENWPKFRRRLRWTTTSSG